MIMDVEGAVVVNTGAAANEVRLEGFEHQNEILGRKGVPLATTYPDCAGFKFGDGRLGAVRRKGCPRI